MFKIIKQLLGSSDNIAYLDAFKEAGNDFAKLQHED